MLHRLISPCGIGQGVQADPHAQRPLYHLGSARGAGREPIGHMHSRVLPAHMPLAAPERCDAGQDGIALLAVLLRSQ